MIFSFWIVLVKCALQVHIWICLFYSIDEFYIYTFEFVEKMSSTCVYIVCVCVCVCVCV